VVEAGPGAGNGRGVGQHAQRARDLGEVASGHLRGRLVADAELEPGRAPVDKRNGALGLDRGHGSVAVLADDVSSVEESASHVLALARVALDHLVVWLKAGVRHLRDRVLLVEGLVCRDDGRVGGEREVDPGEGNQVGLELVEIDIERAVEAEGARNTRDDLGDEAVQVGERGRLDAEVAPADVVDGRCRP